MPRGGNGVLPRHHADGRSSGRPVRISAERPAPLKFQFVLWVALLMLALLAQRAGASGCTNGTASNATAFANASALAERAEECARCKPVFIVLPMVGCALLFAASTVLLCGACAMRKRVDPGTHSQRRTCPPLALQQALPHRIGERVPAD